MANKAASSKAGASLAALQPVLGDAAEFQTQMISLMSASRQGFALFDEHDKLQFANPAFRKALGITSDTAPTWMELMRHGYRQSVGTNIAVAEQDFETWLHSTQTRRGKLPYRTIETRLTDGRWIMMTETTLVGGWMLCVMTDISELGDDWRNLRQERDAALKAALTDDLTGLTNRRYAISWLDSRLGTTKATTMTAVILNIDRFKRVNDTYGHDNGDKVLRHFAGLLQALAGRDDLIARLGGGEFLIALSGKLPETVETVLQQLMLDVSQSRPLIERPDLSYSCSAGIAMALPGEMTRSILQRADQALSQAKREGRGRYANAE